MSEKINPTKENVGIVNIGTYIPEGVHTSDFIAKEADLPKEVVEEKIGVKQKPRANDQEHPSNMGIAAAKEALEDFPAEKLDMVVYCGSEHKDYHLWSLATKIQYELGANNAFAFEVMALCASGALTLQLAKNMMIQQQLDNALIVVASKEMDMVDYKNERSRFMFNFGDGASAVLLRRNYNKNVVLETSIITDGSFSEDVKVDAGGTKNPPSEETVENNMHRLDVVDPDDMKQRLDPVTSKNFMSVVKNSVEKSGYTENDIDFLAPLHMKRSVYDGILEHFGLSLEKSYYLENYGHLQSSDAFVILKKAQELDRLDQGDLVVMIGAGTGFTWGATTVKWGEIE